MKRRIAGPLPLFGAFAHTRQAGAHNSALRIDVRQKHAGVPGNIACRMAKKINDIELLPQWLMGLAGYTIKLERF